MKSMRIRNKPAIELQTASAPSYESPEYPYGLRITLEKDQVMLLEMANAAVDDEVMITAKAKVCGVHKTETQRPNEDSYQHSIDIQITNMEIEKKK